MSALKKISDIFYTPNETQPKTKEKENLFCFNFFFPHKSMPLSVLIHHQQIALPLHIKIQEIHILCRYSYIICIYTKKIYDLFCSINKIKLISFQLIFDILNAIKKKLIYYFPMTHYYYTTGLCVYIVTTHNFIHKSTLTIYYIVCGIL